MTTYDLMLKVKTELENKGFEMIAPNGYGWQAHATKDGKSEYIPVEGYSFCDLYGYRITFETVYRSNGTAENISVDIAIYKWYRSSGRRIARERINTKMGEKAIMNRINKIADLYETL